MLGGVARLRGLGAHGLGGERGPLLPGESKAAVQLVANGESIVEVKRDEGGRDVAGEALDDDADLLHIGLDVIGVSASSAMPPKSTNTETAPVGANYLI